MPVVHVFFYDGESVPVEYNAQTTAKDATDMVADAVELQNAERFWLYKIEKSTESNTSMSETRPNKFTALQPDHRLSEVLGVAETGEATVALLFRKIVLLSEDANQQEPLFAHLCYAQALFEFVHGKHLVAGNEASQLHALQILIEQGPGLDRQSIAFPTEQEWSLVGEVLSLRHTESP